MKTAIAYLLAVVISPELAVKQAAERGHVAAARMEAIIEQAAACVEPGEVFEVHVPSPIVDDICVALRARGDRYAANCYENRCQHYSNVHDCDCIFIEDASARRLVARLRGQP